MRRFLMICFSAIIFSICLMIFANGKDIADIKFGSYHLEASIVTLIIIFSLICFSLIIFIKLIFLIFDSPSIIQKIWMKKKLSKANESLIQSVGQNIIGNKKKSFELINKLNIPHWGYAEEIQSLLKAENSDDVEEQIEFYNKLTNSKDYKFYAYKKLATIYYNKKFIEQAKEYAEKAVSIKQDDAYILEILVHCYVYLKEWDKFGYIASQLKKLNYNKLNNMGGELAKYYIKAAKANLELGYDDIAKNYIENILELSPDNIEAMDLYVALAISSNRYNQAIEMLKLSFKASPSLEIAQLYTKISKDSPEVIFEELSSLLNTEKNIPLLIVLASSLNLPEKIKLYTKSFIQ